MKKLKGELSVLERKIQLTISPKQGLQANEGSSSQEQGVMEVKQDKCADIQVNIQQVHVRI